MYLSTWLNLKLVLKIIIYLLWQYIIISVINELFIAYMSDIENFSFEKV